MKGIKIDDKSFCNFDIFGGEHNETFLKEIEEIVIFDGEADYN